MITVSEVVEALYETFPRDLAEVWDRPGLSVGDPRAEVEGITCALDPTPHALAAARANGSNLLVTHHPAFLNPPSVVTPEAATSSMAGQVVWDACSCSMSLVAMHTNLDRSEQAMARISTILGLGLQGRVEEPDGFGAILEAGLSVGELAALCDKRLGGHARVYGDPRSVAGSVAYCSGSLGQLGRESMNSGCDCVITGECGYHVALDLAESGCSVILLGHDVSEFPYAGLLGDVLMKKFADIPVTVLDESPRWSLGLTRE